MMVRAYAIEAVNELLISKIISKDEIGSEEPKGLPNLWVL